MNITREEDKLKLIEAVAKSHCMRETIKNLGKVPAGGNYEVVRKWIQHLNIDTSHWTRVRRVYTQRKRVNIRDLLVEDIWLTSSSVRKRILKAGILQHKCALCDLGPEWQEKYLTLHLDHINGKRNDYRIENLRLFMP